MCLCIVVLWCGLVRCAEAGDVWPLRGHGAVQYDFYRVLPDCQIIFVVATIAATPLLLLLLLFFGGFCFLLPIVVIFTLNAYFVSL
jgi:hypothetical protein